MKDSHTDDAARRACVWAGGLLLALMPILAWGSVPASDVGDDTPAVETAAAPGDPARAGALKPRKVGFAKAYVIPIQDEINQVTIDSVSRRLKIAVKDGADLVIFDVDTPGGDAFACLQICTEIKNQASIHTIAWVNHQAFSAGAIISMACNEIVMSPRSTLGDSQPIFFTPQGPSAVPDDIEAKVTSPLIEEVRDSARRNDYDMTLCMAMIDPTAEVFWLENTQTGERRFVDRAGRDELFGIDPTAAPARTVTRSVKPGKDADPLTGERQNLVETHTTLKPGERVSDAQSRSAWRYVRSHPLLGEIAQPIDSEKQLLTMSQDEAVAYGFASGIVASTEEFRPAYEIRGLIEDLPYNWSEHLVDWLGSPIVRGILLILVLLGAYVEFHTPGVGLPGLVALICLAIFLGAPYLTGLASVTEIVLVVIGVGLLLVELFVLPGFGVAGVVGLLLIFAGLLLSFTPAEPGPIHWPRFDYTLTALKHGLLAITGGVLASIAGGVVLSRFLPKMPLFGRIVAPNPTAEVVRPPDPYGNLARVGDIGVAEGVLRPAGKARFGQVLVDVVTEGEFIAPSARVEVVERQGNRVVVRRYEA